MSSSNTKQTEQSNKEEHNKPFALKHIDTMPLPDKTKLGIPQNYSYKFKNAWIPGKKQQVMDAQNLTDLRKAKNIKKLLDVFALKVSEGEYSLAPSENFGIDLRQSQLKLGDPVIMSISQLLHLKQEIEQNLTHSNSPVTSNGENATTTDESMLAAVQQYSAQKTTNQGLEQAKHDESHDDTASKSSGAIDPNSSSKDISQSIGTSKQMQIISNSSDISVADDSKDAIKETIKSLEEDIASFETKFCELITEHEEQSLSLLHMISQLCIDNIYQYIPEAVIKDFLNKNLPLFRDLDVKIYISDEVYDKIATTIFEDDDFDLRNIISSRDVKPGNCELRHSFSRIIKDKDLIMKELNAIMQRHIANVTNK